MSDRIDTGSAPAPLGAYPHARRSGPLLFLSGIGPRRSGERDIPGVTLDANGVVVDYNIETQCRSCFENVRAVLEAAGLGMDRVVDVLVFLTDMRRDFATYNKVYAEYFAGEHAPARTTVEVSRLPQGGSAPIAIEVKVVAMVPVSS